MLREAHGLNQPLDRNQSTLPVLRRKNLLGWGFPELFIISQIAFPAFLYLPGTQLFRIPLRIGAFGISLIAFAWWLNQHSKKDALHPATKWLALVMIWVTLMIFHPTTNTMLAGFAQIMLYLAVIAPVFWAPRLVNNPTQLKRLLWILLVCNSINSLVGVMQVYDPIHWLPHEFTSIYATREDYFASLVYTNDQGQVIRRPPGLGDNPGAVCNAGMLAAVIGLFFLFREIAWWKRFIVIWLAILGLSAVYLSQVRTWLLIAGGILIVYSMAIGFLQKQFFRAFLLLGATIGVFTLALFYSTLFGGEAVAKRMATLFDSDPVTVYYQNRRGDQLEYALRESFGKYPLGAGLARWGMMRLYFGDEHNPNSPSLWSELQIPSWLYDGGWLMILLYSIALLVTIKYDLRLVRKARDRELIKYAPMVLALNAGVIALAFGFTPFTTQVGMQYWFLAGAVFGAARKIEPQ